MSGREGSLHQLMKPSLASLSIVVRLPGTCLGKPHLLNCCGCLFLATLQVREIYETAIESVPPGDLPEADIRSLCVRYAQLERKLGEVDRARAVFVHGSHLADPRTAK